jgi:hypothetical protein
MPSALQVLHGFGFIAGTRVDLYQIAIMLENLGLLAFPIDARLGCGGQRPKQ